MSRLAGTFAAAGARGYHYRLLAALQEFGPASQASLGRRSGIDRSDVVAGQDTAAIVGDHGRLAVDRVLVVRRGLHGRADAREAEVRIGGDPRSRALAPHHTDFGTALGVLLVDQRQREDGAAGIPLSVYVLSPVRIRMPSVTMFPSFVTGTNCFARPIAKDS